MADYPCCTKCRQPIYPAQGVRGSCHIWCAPAPKGHKRKMVSVGLSDHCECSCGWKSPGYWDGQEYAFDDWQKHVGWK
jgi:hypothetical protein